MTKGKNSHLIEHCFSFCCAHGRPSNEINKCSVFPKCGCGIFACDKGMLWFERAAKNLFSLWADRKSIHQRWSFHWAIVCKDIVRRNRLKRDKHDSLIRNEVLRDQKYRLKIDQWNCFPFYWICSSQCQVMMFFIELHAIHKEKYMHVCLILIKLEPFYVI